MSRPPGMRVGPYCLLRHLRSGGTAEVYEAVHTHLDLTVALKLLSPAMAADPQIVARFLQESRALAQIQHPGVVQVRHSDSNDAEPAYVAMEILTGQSLRDALRACGGRLPTTQVIQIGSQVSDAMVAVHAVGIVHRDIKPENLFLVAASEKAQGLCVKIIDFGISKVPSSSKAQVVDTQVQTSAPSLLGTPLYMAPEQCRNPATVTGQADVYALGVVLFELLAGRPPFTGEESIDVMTQHLHATPPLLAECVPDVPHELAVLIAAMLGKDPAQRPTMAQVRDGLKGEWFPAPPRDERRNVPPRRPKRPGWEFFAAGATVLLVTLSGGMAFREHKQRVEHLQSILGEVEQLVTDSDWVYAQLPHTIASRRADLRAAERRLTALSASERVHWRVRAALISVRHRRGDVELQSGLVSEAAAHYNAARTEFGQTNPRNPSLEVSKLLALNASKRGKVALARGQNPEARRAFDDAASLLERSQPTTPDEDFLRTLGTAYLEQADVAMIEDRKGDAGSLYAKAVARLERLPADGYNQALLASALVSSADAAMQAKMWESAASSLERAKPILMPLVQSQSGNLLYRLSLGRLELALFRLKWQAGLKAKAATVLSQALELGQALHHDDPTQKQYALFLGQVLEEDEALQRQEDSIDKADRVKAKRCQLAAELVRADPEDARPRKLLCL